MLRRGGLKRFEISWGKVQSKVSQILNKSSLAETSSLLQALSFVVTDRAQVDAVDFMFSHKGQEMGRIDSKSSDSKGSER